LQNFDWKYCKPFPEAYAKALEIVNAKASECVFIDDNPRNTKGALKSGMLSILISEKQNMYNCSYYSISKLLDLSEVIAVE
jgi:FMN phosphatase YigB (HAD superfamily)